MQLYVIVSPEGVYWIGLHDSEFDAWSVALGWPNPSEIEWYKSEGWYCAKAQATWKDPRKQSDNINLL